MKKETLIANIESLLDYANTNTLNVIYRLILKSVPADIKIRHANEKIRSKYLTKPNKRAIIDPETEGARFK